MSGFALGPILAGSMLSQLAWHWLLAVNLPVAAIAVLGVRIGIPADAPGDLHDAPLDAPGAVLTMLMMGSTAYVLTSGVEHGWTAPLTLLAALVAVASTAGFVRRERTAEHPMLDLTLLANRTIRGAALAQLGGSVAMIGAIFALTLHFQDAYGWSPMRAGLANLPFVVTMLLATPVAEQLAARLGHRIATLVAAATLTEPGGHGLGSPARVCRHRRRNGRDDHRPANHHDHLRDRARRCDAGQPHFGRSRPQRHRAGGGH
ncbi:hypothetical protein [Nostocoides vanveenii]|uniref:Uncharacterized protein n=1 Tax=Nostocoides vanveenii TaxID=330835 RepID=A0ABP4WUG3_9MICO